MSDSGKRWEDEPSTQGLGLLQSALGIPNSPLYTKGELSFKQQQELIDATKNLTSQISNQDMRVVATDPYTNIQVLESVEEQIKDGFRSYIRRAEEENAAREWARENERMERENREAEREREKRSQLQRQAVIIGRGIEDMRREVGNVGLGVSVANSHLGHLNSSVSSIDSNISSIDGGVRRVAGSLDSMARTQALQADYLKKIEETISSSGQDTNALLKNLADLAIENIQQQTEQHRATQTTIKYAFDNAIATVMFSLEGLRGQLVARMDIVNLNLARINNTGTQIRDAVTRNTIEARANAIATTGAIRENTIAVTGAIRENTATIQDLANRSEEIRAQQYQDNGRELFESGLYEEALTKLLKAQSYFSDFETSFLLAKTYLKLEHLEKARSQLIAAEKQAQNPRQMGMSRVLMAQLLKKKGEKKEATAVAMNSLAVSPTLLYSELKDFWENHAEICAMLIELRKDSAENPNVLALCLAEFSKGGHKILVEEVFDEINNAYAKGKLMLSEQSEILDRASDSLLPLLQEYLDCKQQEVSPGMCFWISKLLLERNLDQKVARQMLTEGLRRDPIIADLVRKRDYKEILKYLNIKLGKELFRLKDFPEVPLSIRKLIRK